MKRKRPPKRLLAVALTVGLAAVVAMGIGYFFYGGSPEPQEKVTIDAPPKGVYWFQDDHFGVMITWGPVSMAGKEISWSRGGGRPCDESRERTDLLPKEKYDNLYHGFSPTSFDADAWVDLVKRAGARYLVFVTKHHDGFCMFDSKLTEYKVTRSFYGLDVTEEVAGACHRAGLRLGFYYSLPDWVHADYCTTRHNAYIKYLHGQVRELCTNYGSLDIVWFEGLTLRAADWDAATLVAIVNELQPEALINDRAGVPGSFTSREEIGEPDLMRPWERAMTLGTQWSFKPDDTLKSASECLCELLRAAGRGGNLLLNVGPQPDGRIEPRQAETLLQIGTWLDQNGEGVYQTRAGPYWPTDAYVSTRRDRSVYLHLLKRPTGRIELPAYGRKLLTTAMLSGGSATATQKDDRFSIAVELPEGDEPPWTIRLELDGAPPPMKQP